MVKKLSILLLIGGFITFSSASYGMERHPFGEIQNTKIFSHTNLKGQTNSQYTPKKKEQTTFARFSDSKKEAYINLFQRAVDFVHFWDQINEHDRLDIDLKPFGGKLICAPVQTQLDQILDQLKANRRSSCEQLRFINLKEFTKVPHLLNALKGFSFLGTKDHRLIIKGFEKGLKEIEGIEQITIVNTTLTNLNIVNSMKSSSLLTDLSFSNVDFQETNSLDLPKVETLTFENTSLSTVNVGNTPSLRGLHVIGDRLENLNLTASKIENGSEIVTPSNIQYLSIRHSPNLISIVGLEQTNLKRLSVGGKISSKLKEQLDHSKYKNTVEFVK